MDVEEVYGGGTNTMVMGEWVGKGENLGGISGTKPELVGDVWVIWGIVATQGGEMLGLRLKYESRLFVELEEEGKSSE